MMPSIKTFFFATLLGATQGADFLRGADQGRRELAVCVDQLPNLDADTCGNTQCTSKDLEIVGAYLETDGCLQCSCGEQVTANLKLRIKNKTGSYRTAFGYTANLVEKPAGCGESVTTEITPQCVDERCSDEGVEPTGDGYKELGFGTVTFQCGSELTLTNVLQFWTDASSKSTCSSYKRCQDLSPKCGRPEGDITIESPLFVAASATCIPESSGVNVVTTVTGGSKDEPIHYEWSDGSHANSLTGVADGSYSVTVSQAGSSCTASASVTEQNCCYFEATCKALENQSLPGCDTGVVPSAMTDFLAVFEGITSAPCGSLTMSVQDIETGSLCSNDLTLTRTYKLEDASGNFITCDQAFVITNAVPPAVDPLTDANQQCASGCAADGADGCFDTPVATAYCGGAVELTPSGVTKLEDTCGASSDVGVYEQTWTATDVCGLQSTVKQTITIVNDLPPTIDPLTDAELQCASGCAADGAEGCFDTPIATATCGAISLTPSGVMKVQDTCGPSSDAGVYEQTWTATDSCGLQSTVTQTITIKNDLPPSISPLNNLEQDCANGCAANGADGCFTTPTVTTVCGGEVELLPSGVTKVQDTCGPSSDAGVYEQTWTATDSCGLQTTASQTITIVNNVPPTIDPLTDLEQECASGCAADGSTEGCFTSPTVTSICGGDVQLTSTGVTKIQDTCGPDSWAGLYEQTWTATDSCGLETTASQTVTIVDTTAPSIDGMNKQETFGCDAAIPEAPTLSATDSCGPVTVDFACCLEGGDISRTWTATDACGNTDEKNHLMSITCSS